MRNPTKRRHKKFPALDAGDKVCRSCDRTKKLTLFPTNARYRDGRDISCKECCATKTKRWRRANPQAARQSENGYRARNREKVAARAKAYLSRWRKQKPEVWAAYARAWQKQNAEVVRDRARQYDKRNPHLSAARASLRRARLLAATPPWLTPEHIAAILAFFERARWLTVETGIPHEVDHIEPLRGQFSCGLHVPWNLRVITASENRRKWIHPIA